MATEILTEPGPEALTKVAASRKVAVVRDIQSRIGIYIHTHIHTYIHTYTRTYTIILALLHQSPTLTADLNYNVAH